MSELMTYWSISSIKLVKEAESKGLAVEIISENKNLFTLGNDEKTILFKGTDFGVNTSLGYKIARDKELSYDLLEKSGVPIPKTSYLDKGDMDSISSDYLDGFSYPLVIKPVGEAHGDGVKMNLLSFDEVCEKLSASFELYERMIIQEQVSGDECRILVLGDDVLVSTIRVPAHVVGDGKNSIQDLMSIENKANDLRGPGYNYPLAELLVDDELIGYIHKNGYTLESVVGESEVIQLRGNSNIGTGGTVIDNTDVLCDEIKEVCISAAKSCGLAFCGVDVLSTDFSKPLGENGGVILELNGTPGIGFYGHGFSIDPTEKIINFLF